MSDQVNVFTSAPAAAVFRLLSDRLPSTLPLLRRLQFASHQACDTSGVFRVVLVWRPDREYTEGPDIRVRSRAQNDNDPGFPPHSFPFTMAFVEFGDCPDTQMWIYSTLEDIPSEELPAKEEIYRAQFDALVGELVQLKTEFEGESAFGQSVLLGSAHEKVMSILKDHGRYEHSKAGSFEKWIFREEALPKEDKLPDGMTWNTANVEDCKVAISHATIPRPMDTLMQSPSLVVKSSAGDQIAWGFLAPDASLTYLHCEKSHRRQGLARALASKLFRESTRGFGSDGWCSADVRDDNENSRALCQSLGGEPYWISSWVLFDLGQRALATE